LEIVKIPLALVGAKQVSSASPAFDLSASKGKAGEAFALPLRLKTVNQHFLHP
jgi:hypothetical protein